MDPVLESIFLGLFVNGLSSLVGTTGKKFLNSFSKSKSLNSIISNNELSRIEGIISKESEKIELKSIYEFIGSIEVASIVRQIYALEIEEKNYSIKIVQEEFNLLFSRYFETNEDNTKYLSSMLFQSLFLGCREVCLSTHLRQKLQKEERDSIEFNIIRDQITNIQNNVELLTTNNQLNVKEIHEFIEEYRRSIENRYELVRAITYENQLRVPFEDIYVYPRLVRFPGKSKQSRFAIDGLETSKNKCIVENEFIKLDEFLSNAYRAVILGDPGAGKTTLAKKICYDLTKHSSEKLFLNRKITPILVTLRDYQTKCLEANVSILDYITTESNSSYQMQAPNGAFKYLLFNGYILLIFDGLDELLEVSSREDIVDKIESFCTHYPSVPILVTSRKIGYEQAPLSRNLFEKFELASFDNDQVKEYVYKWFALDPDLTEKEKISKANSFLEESEIVEDLRSNCLMLSLMCSIYKEENYIPENRPQIYQECAEMFLKKWDTKRKITPKLYVPESKIKSLVAYLAYSIFINESYQEGITESKLIAKSIEYLHGAVYADRDKAELAAKGFIKFCKGRAWVLTEFGYSRGEGTYKFTHRTFLEYFTAYWIVWKNNLDEISELLLDHICVGEWDDVAQLSFQIKCETSEGGEELFCKLIKRAETEEYSFRFNLLSFSARCLQFIVPSPKIAREITKACFKFTIDNGMSLITQLKSKKSEPNYSEYHLSDLNFIFNRASIKEEYILDPLSLIWFLKTVRKENVDTVGHILKDLIIKSLFSVEENESYLAAEICLLIRRFDDTFLMPYNNEEFWEHLSDEILDQLFNPNFGVFCQNRNLSCHLCLMGKISLDYFVKLHGFRSIFYNNSYVMAPLMEDFGIASNLLLEFSHNSPDCSMLVKTGSLFLSTSLPLNLGSPFKEHQFLFGTSSRFLFDNTQINVSFSENNDWYFGVFCLSACAYELIMVENNLKETENSHFNEPSTPYILLRKIISCKIMYPKILNQEITSLGKEIEKINLSNEQKLIILNWVTGDIHFLDPITFDTN